MQKGKLEEALQIAEKGRETKGKGEKERYTHLNAEFQRIPRRKIYVHPKLVHKCLQQNYL